MASARAREFAIDLGELHDTLKLHICQAQQCYQKAANNCHLPPPNFKIRQKIYVKEQFIQTTRPLKKLSEKNLGPYEIITSSLTLCLLQSMCAIHLVYHISMLEPAPSSAIPNRTEDPPPPIEIEGEIEYKIAKILDTKLDRRRLLQTPVPC
jgi:hypothetical protein